MKKLASKLFFLLGLVFFLISFYFLWQRVNPARLSFASEPTHEAISIKGSKRAERIIVRSLSIDVPVIESAIENGIYKTTSQGVSHLSSTPFPGERGNSVLYGHNWTNIFGNLVNIRVGDTVEVMFSDGTSKNFVVDSIATVESTQVSVLDQTQDSRITLYTCRGFLDSKRFVVVAKSS